MYRDTDMYCVRVFSYVTGIWHHSVSLLIIGFHIVRISLNTSLIRPMIAHSCSTLVRNLQWVLHLRLCVPSWICGLSSCRHLLGIVQLLRDSVLQRPNVPEPSPDRGSGQRTRHSEVCIPGCLRLTRKKATWDALSRYCWSSYLHLAGVRTGFVLQRSCFHPHPRTAVVRVRTSMLITSSELSASTADAAFEFSVSVLASAFFASAPRHDVLQHSLAFWTFQSDSVFSSSMLFSCEDQSLLFLTSKLHHFFTRASWATTVALSTIALFLITSRIECVTTFAQAFQRSDQIARCALHRTFRVGV